MADELDDALALADRVLDQPFRDPDDDLSMLARHLFYTPLVLLINTVIRN